VAVMGYWPSFHDANVKEVVRQGESCRVVVHVFEMTAKVDSNGYFVLTKHHLVAIRMSGIAECTLPTNYKSYCLFGIDVERVDYGVKVVFESAIDPESTWHVSCREAAVMNVVPCDSRGGPAVT
jgi:hypothetical protein